MLAWLKQILAQYFIPFFLFLDRCKSCMDWIWWDLLSTDFLWLDLTNPLFFIFVNLSKNQCSQSSIWQHNLTSPFFFIIVLSIFSNKCLAPSLIFIILVCLHWIDVLWHNLTTSLFYHSLSNHHKVKVLRHILTLPLFFNFFFATGCPKKNFKIEFLRFANYPPSSCQRSRWWRSRRWPSWCSPSFRHQTLQ